MTRSAADAARAFVARVWNARDLAAFDAHVSRDVVHHPPRGPTRDYAGYRAMVEAFLRAFPDLRFDVGAAAEDGDLVGLRLRITGTHSGGEFLGVPPRGKRVDVAAHPWLRVRDGKVVESWTLFDERGMLEQLAAD